MFNPFTEDILIRGVVLEVRDSSTLIVKFIKSSAFWDESELGEKGKEIILIDVKNAKQYKAGDKMIARVNIFTNATKAGETGDQTVRGTNTTKEIYPDHYQPIGVDWRESFWILIIIFLVIIIVLFARVRKFTLLLW